MKTYHVYLSCNLPPLEVRADSVISGGACLYFEAADRRTIAEFRADCVLGWIRAEEKPSLWKRLLTLLNRKI